MLIDIEIAIAPEAKIKPAMASEQLQHVIEEANAGGDFVLATPIDVQHQCDFGFVRIAVQLGGPHGAPACACVGDFSGATQSMAFNTFGSVCKSRSVCSAAPTVMRTQPSHPGSLLRSRTRMPRFFISETKSACLAPIFASTKFAWLTQYGIPWQASWIMSRPRP